MKRLASLVLVLSSFAGVGCGSAALPKPQTLSLDGALGNKFVKAGAPTEVMARLVVAARAPETSEKPPVNLALVIDTSGSMEGKAIADARAASAAFIGELTRKDRLAVILFNSRTEVLLPSTKLADVDTAELGRKIAAIKAEGTTDMAHGLEAGLAEVTRDMDPAAVNRVVLLGDGVPNEDASIADQARAAGSRGVSITAFGLGPDYDETLMGSVALLSGGRFHYIDDSTKIAKFFGEEIARLTRAEAKNAYLELTPGPGVTIDNVVGQSWAHVGGARVRIPLGDLSRGDSRELVVKMTASGRRSGAAVEIMDAVVHYADATGGGDLEQRLFLGARAVEGESEIKSGKNDDVEKADKRAEAAADTVEAIRLARAGDVPAAQKKIDAVNQNAPATDEPTRRQRQELNDALPALAPAKASTGSGGGAAMKSAPKPSPPVVRSMHDQAMQMLQGQ